MTTETELFATLDLDKSVVCEVVWHDREKGPLPCINEATWTGLAHDEVMRHDNAPILLCGKCVLLVKTQNHCEDCHVPLLSNIRRI